MNVEVETPVEVTDPDVIETPVETVAEPETVTAPEPTAEATDDPLEDDETDDE